MRKITNKRMMYESRDESDITDKAKVKLTVIRCK